jgi:hypothetical protein
MHKIRYIAAVLIAVAGLGLQQAKADTFTSFITVPNDNLSGFTGPYAEVIINRTSDTMASVTFMSLTNTFNGNPVIYLMGGASCADLNVNGTFTVSDLMKSNSGTGFLSTHTVMGKTVADLSVGTSGNVSQFGDFNLRINNFDGFTHSASTISFDLTATGGTTWATANSVLFFNALDYDAAAHVFPSALPAVASNNVYGSLTGFAGEFIGASVPDDGTTAMLLGAGLSGLVALRHYLKR